MLSTGDSSTDDDSAGNEEGDHEDPDSGTPQETQQLLIHSDSSSTGSASRETPMLRPPKLPERNRYVRIIARNNYVLQICISKTLSN